MFSHKTPDKLCHLNFQDNGNRMVFTCLTHFQTNMFPAIIYFPNNYQPFKRNYLSVKYALILKNILIMRSLKKSTKKSGVTASFSAVVLGWGA